MSATGGPEADLGIPTRQSPTSLGWSALAMGLLLAGVAVVMILEPAGFDRCEAVPSAAAETIQRVAAVGTVSAAALLAIWRLRGWWRSAVLITAGLVAAGWLVLLNGSQSC